MALTTTSTSTPWHAFLLLEFKDTHKDHDDRWKPSKEEIDILLDKIDPENNAVAMP